MPASARSAAEPAHAVEDVRVRVATIPTDRPESDGTFAWDATTIVVVRVRAGGREGLGYTYGPAAAGALVEHQLAGVVEGTCAMDIPSTWLAMERRVRNMGRQGIAALAISAVDIALWDLKARLLDLPLTLLIGRFHERAPVYGSGGFCSYSDAELAEQMRHYTGLGLPRVKIKVGRDPDRDPHRCAVVRDVIGDGVELFVDANGAYDRQEALGWCRRFWDEFGVTYVEEPVSSEDLEGLRFVRDRAPAGQAIAAGEYCWDLLAVARMLPTVHVQQVDVTRCGGITNFLRAGALCQAHQAPLSAHCAPNLSAHVCCGVQTLAHIEYFHDHVRIEEALFEGTLSPRDGALEPDLSRPGHGLQLREDAFDAYAVHGD